VVKNSGLEEERTFPPVIVRDNYPDQKAFVVAVGENVWRVPFLEDEESVFLITAWAAKAGIPYQTLIKPIPRRFATGQLDQ